MLTERCFEAYEASGLEGQIGYLEPSGIAINFPNDDTVVAPHDETEATFLDRIERSKKAGRSLFRDEWEPLVYEPGCVY